MIRDRKMYVAPTPFHLAEGTEGRIALIARAGELNDPRLRQVGTLNRVETQQTVASYTFDLTTNSLDATLTPNPTAGKVHEFAAFRPANDPGPRVSLTGRNGDFAEEVADDED